MIKQKCAWCDARINNDAGRYMLYGNSCSICSCRFSTIMAGKRNTRLNKYGHIQNYKEREFTTEERDEMLIARINEVKQNHEHSIER